MLGISQRERQVSRKYHLRILREPTYPLSNAGRRAKRRVGYYSAGARLMRFLRRLFR